ncbi:MAG: MotE family protein, partial [Hyphomicrobiaceae bacterium]
DHRDTASHKDSRRTPGGTGGAMTRLTKIRGKLAFGIASLSVALLVHTSAVAASKTKKKMMPPKASPVRPAAETLAEKYCVNISDAATDARMAWQAQTIKGMSKKLDKKIEQLEVRTQEYKKWLARREAFINKATTSLIEIYAKMRPDAAAIQLTTLDVETASAILTKLKARTSSAILAEMDPKHAAKLASVIAGSAKVRTGKGA